MSRKERLEKLSQLTDADYDSLVEKAESICDVCFPTERQCENCELCSLMSDLVYEFETRRKEEK